MPANAAAAPLVAPSTIEPEPVVPSGSDAEGGVPGGVEGGLPGGVLGGVVGGLPSAPSPAPPPPPVRRAPVRVGGNIQAPALLRKIPPIYPAYAVQARLEGVVILEAEVDESGAVAQVRVLKSVGLLDHSAITAVRQWRYSPLLLNGRPERFVLTVTLSFSLTE